MPTEQNLMSRETRPPAMELRHIVLHVLTCKRKQVDALPLDDLTRSFVQLLTAGSDPNSANPRGKTCLHHIASHWDKDNRSSNLNAWVRNLLHSLIQAGADVNKRDEHGRTSLHYAAMAANVEMFRTLLSAGAEPDLADEKNNTPLLLAMENSKFSNATMLDIAQQLIDAEANVNATKEDGATVLHYACDRGDVEIVNLLLSRGASPTDADENGFNALVHAVKSDHMEIVRILIDKGSDVNGIVREKLNTPMTALHYAISNDNVEMLEYLLEHGADPNRLKSLGKCILIYVLSDIRVIGRKHSRLKLLLSHKADVHADDPSNAKSLFELLVLKGRAGEIRLILEHGFDFSRFSPRARKDFSPLHQILRQDIDAYRRLLAWLEYDKKRSLDLNHIDASGETPLSLAAKTTSMYPCVCLLIEWGADVNRVNSRRLSPLRVAVFCAGKAPLRIRRNLDVFCIQSLVKAGAKLGNILNELVPDPPADVETSNRYENIKIARRLEIAQRIVKHRFLFESRKKIADPSEHVGINMPVRLQHYCNSCKTELDLLKNIKPYNSLTYHNVLDEKFYRRVREDQVYEALDEEDLKSRFSIYGEDVFWHLRSMKIMHATWENAVKNLGLHLGLHHDTHYLILDNILKRLCYKDLSSVAKSI